MKTVKDIMSPAICVLSLDDPLSDAIRNMSQGQRSCALVCSQGKLLGIVTERDIVRVVAEQLNDFDASSYRISEVMTAEPICVNQKTSVLDALLLARTHKVRHIPVVNKHEKLVGIVTQSDNIDAYLDSIKTNDKLKKDYDALKLLSLEDPLVGAGNRRALDVDLAYTDAAAKRWGKPYSVAMIDIDYFKKYNDHYGHQEGDVALKEVVEIIKTNMRDADRLFRYGGEEFLLLMPNTNLDQSHVVAERIRTAIAEENIPHKKSPLQYLTVSVGVAECGVSKDIMIKSADEALYRAKNNGRNSTETASPEEA